MTSPATLQGFAWASADACIKCIKQKACAASFSRRSRTHVRWLLDQPFSLHGLLDLRPCTNPGHERFDVGPLCEIDLVDVGPVDHREQIGVRYCKFVARNELLSLEQLLESVETTSDYTELNLLHFSRQLRVEKRADLLVYFG